MKTAITNRLRYVLDNCLPPLLRDARFFMTPFFYVWFKGKHVGTAMEFKKLAPTLSDEELREVYRVVDNMGSSRPTDTNSAALRWALDTVRRDSRSLLDVGCGRGFFLQRLAAEARLADVQLYGCDLPPIVHLGRGNYANAAIERLPFADRSIDVVTCFHTLEHTRDFERCVAELKRVARRQLIIVVPRQRYYYYTLDLHLQFFPSPEALAIRLGVDPAEVREFGSDLAVVMEQPG